MNWENVITLILFAIAIVTPIIKLSTTVTRLSAIDYGNTLPDYLTAALTQQLTAAGIDPTALAALLPAE